MKHKIIKKAVSNVVLIGLLFNPLSFVLAQTTTTSTPSADQTTTTTATSTPDTLTIPIGPAQDTSNSQVTIPSSALESTINPNTDLGTTTPSVDTATSTPPSATTTPPVTTATSTPPTSTTTPEIIIPKVDVTSPPMDTTIQTTEQVSVVSTVDIQNLAPKSEYSFRIGTTKIATKKINPKDASLKKTQPLAPQEEMVTTDLSPQVDQVKGVVSFSGACSDKYYVVLLYKNADDYSTNPRSYILNKAFPCVNNSYSYSIESLPDSLANGTYYLLVGGMGDVGSWTPITSLTPIDINKNN